MCVPFYGHLHNLFPKQQHRLKTTGNQTAYSKSEENQSPD
jgi:hypothetical protein